MKCLWVMLGGLMLAGSLFAQDSSNHADREMHGLHQDSEAYIAVLEDPRRDDYQKHHEVITALDLRNGEVIADSGETDGEERLPDSCGARLPALSLLPHLQGQPLSGRITHSRHSL